ncbi:MAG TPA: 30S ribosomal protein S13, partial [Humisphaera sp.]
MPRIAGIDIPSDKKIKVSLRYIFGVGPTNAMAILKEAAIDPERRAKDLTEEELAKIITIMDRTVLVEGALRRQIGQNIGRLRDINSYRGNRHRRSLPTRGQRTRSNARTR